MANLRSALRQFFVDVFYFPSVGRGVHCIWRRNFLYFRYTLVATMLWIFIEPMLYIFAFGFGLGRFVAHIDGVNYAEFIAPGLMATSGMFVAFFEGTYGTYVKLSRQNTFSTIILTPVGSDEITLGEILWAASKAFLSVISVTAVLAVMGLVPIVRLAPAAAVLFVLCWVFAAMGVWLASIARSFEWFTYAQSGFVLPMSLFCGTYFPLSQMPTFLQKLALLLPLTHALQSVRMFFAGEFNSMFFVNMMYLFVLGIIFTNLASARFERKLVV